ncbi:MAG: metallophosphoesterase, partial [Deltaproteobacteria bacterium]|nr:metallophosphoesterase [Deltaproteobacteria bacterium]
MEVKTLITLGHLSDLHATDPSRASVRALLSKRFFGWLSWRLNRRRLYRREVAEALLEDLKRESPDHVAVTGDLINISLHHEFEAAARMLSKLGSPEWVSLVPGNHDAYVDVSSEHGWGHWAAYLASDAARPDETPPTAPSSGNSNMFSFPEAFPTVRIRGDLALIGVCTALPTPPFFATGKAGKAQLDRLESTLEDLRTRDLCRVVLVHHPVVDDHVSRRRRLRDSAQLRGERVQDTRGSGGCDSRGGRSLRFLCGKQSGKDRAVSHLPARTRRDWNAPAFSSVAPRPRLAGRHARVHRSRDAADAAAQRELRIGVFGRVSSPDPTLHRVASGAREGSGEIKRS